MRSVSAWVVGIGFALAVAGLALLPLTTPAFTRAAAARFSLAEEAGLPKARMLAIAEQVRAFVIDAEGDTLPATVDGRSGFDVAAVAHLIDVRDVIRSARMVTGVVVLLLTVWVVVQIRRQRIAAIAGALGAGSVLTLVLVALAAVAAFSDFESFFTAFHSLFFASGTWTFEYDSLLIQTFPEAFWITGGAAWAGLMVAGAGVLGVVAWLLGRSHRESTLKVAQ